MEIFFLPLSCSLATRIVCYEVGAEARFVEVDRATKRTLDGRDFTAIHPLGLVPTVCTDDGLVLTEVTAILQWLAERHPTATSLPETERGRTELREWLGFLNTELHKLVFSPLLDPGANDGARTYALQKAESRFEQLSRKLGAGPFALGAAFGIVDAYLFTVLVWTQAVAIDLKRWPNLTAYVARVKQRPSVRRAYDEELVLYRSRLGAA